MRVSTLASTAAVFSAGAQAAASPYASPSAYTPYINFNTVAYITETLSAYTTYFSAATQLALPDTTYTISEPTTLTLTKGGPFTVVRPLIAQTIVAGCATCYATAPFSTPSLDANGTTVGTAHLRTTATATQTVAPSSSSASSSQARDTKTKTKTKPATSAAASSSSKQQQQQSGKTLTLPPATTTGSAAGGGAVIADTLAPAPPSTTTIDAAAVSSSADSAAPVYTGAAGHATLSSSLSLLGTLVVVGLGPFALVW